MIVTISLLVISVSTVVIAVYTVKNYQSSKKSEELLSGTITTVPPRVRRQTQRSPD